MPRILGVDIPREKKIEYALPYLFGIGLHRSREILEKAKIDCTRRAKDLSDEEIAKLATIIQTDYLIEGELKREVHQNIRRHMDMASCRGMKHRRGLPVRGQRSKTNARTRKGRKSSVGRVVKSSGK